MAGFLGLRFVERHGEKELVVGIVPERIKGDQKVLYRGRNLLWD